MKSKLALLLIVTFFTISAMSQNRTEMGRYSKSFTGSDGASVVIARYGADANNEILVFVNGVDHSWNNRIFLAKANTSTGTSRDFSINIKGKGYTVLSWKDGNYTLYMPFENIMEPVQQALKYSGTAYDETPERLLTKYLEQKN